MEDALFLKSKDGLILKYVKRSMAYNMPSIHFHNSYEIYYLIKGERYYYIENKKFHISPGTLVIINANQLHYTSLVDNVEPFHERILIQFDSNTIDALFPNQEFDIPTLFGKHFGVLSLDKQSQKHVEHILYDMLKESRDKPIGYQTIIQMRLKELLISLHRKLNHLAVPLHSTLTNNQTTQKILNITEYISNNYNTITCIDDITKEFYLDKSYLCRKFKEVTGHTIHDFLNIKRIQQSQILLQNEDLKINDIAKLVGYNSASTYIKTYNKYQNMSPLKYRKSLNKV